MTSLKKKILETENVSDQTSLVKKLIGQTGPRIVKRVIPAGKNMFTQIGKNDMEGAVYNWLRGVGGFSQVTISFAKDPDKWVPSPTKVESFDTSESKPVWERSNQGRKELAKKIAHLINDSGKRIVYIMAKHDGLYIGEDKTGGFKARVPATEADVAKDPSLNIGDKIASADWEPYLEFHATNRSKYTNYNAQPKAGT